MEFASHYVNIALPVNVSEITDEFYKSVTEIILSNGVFGLKIPFDEK